MRMIDINNDKRIYVRGSEITFDRSGCPPMKESDMHMRLAKALSLRDSLDIAITDMRTMLKEE